MNRERMHFSMEDLVVIVIDMRKEVHTSCSKLSYRSKQEKNVECIIREKFIK